MVNESFANSMGRYIHLITTVPATIIINDYDPCYLSQSKYVMTTAN